jgi:hypothetical protein
VTRTAPRIVIASAARHCEPTGRRDARPDDRLREAIQCRAKQRPSSLRAITKQSSVSPDKDSGSLRRIAPRNDGVKDCFVAVAPLHKRFAFVAGNDRTLVIASASEAIQCLTKLRFLDCFVAHAPRNDGVENCFVAVAPLRKRFAFVAGNDGPSSLRAIAKQSSVSPSRDFWIASSLMLLAMTIGGSRLCGSDPRGHSERDARLRESSAIYQD